ncbi:MAG: ABC transporter ATP-binding protein [Anaerolineales bacterium]|nr:ABC transporter ATP-binding protein [Anaerolineales bacterium]MCB9128236.1 ABC transporter ATP-binding protein [Ardenticatenales bacterium]
MIHTNDLTKEYRSGTTVRAVDALSFDVAEGELLSIVGPSGSGKSTLLNLLGTLDHPTSGQIEIDGENVGKLRGNRLADFRRQHIGFVFQLFNLIPVLTALENVTIPLVPYRRKSSFNLEERGKALLDEVGLGHRLDHRPGQLSGGEQQRVAIARALLNRPKLILADEPTGNLDTTTGATIMALLRRLNREQGLTIVMVTHDPQVAAQADRTLRMQDGRIAA